MWPHASCIRPPTFAATLSPEAQRVKSMKPLLPQPGGFEGLLRARVHLHPDSLSVLDRPNHAEPHLDGNPGGLRAPPLVNDGDDPLSGVDVVLDRELQVIPCLGPVGVEPPCAFDPGVGLLLGPATEGRHVPDEVRVRVLGEEFTGRHEVLEAAPQSLHVLLRHRLRSISRQQLVAQYWSLLLSRESRSVCAMERRGACLVCWRRSFEHVTLLTHPPLDPLSRG